MEIPGTNAEFTFQNMAFLAEAARLSGVNRLIIVLDSYVKIPTGGPDYKISGVDLSIVIRNHPWGK